MITDKAIDPTIVIIKLGDKNSKIVSVSPVNSAIKAFWYIGMDIKTDTICIKMFTTKYAIIAPITRCFVKSCPRLMQPKIVVTADIHDNKANIRININNPVKLMPNSYSKLWFTS